MTTAALAVWIITVIVGGYLLASGITAEHKQAAPRAQADAPAGDALPAGGAGPDASRAAGADGPAGDGLADGSVADAGGVADAGEARGAGNPGARQVAAATPAGTAAAHPLLEFCHPALGVIGLMFWLFFVVSGHAKFAWIAFGTLAVTALAGITWLITGIERRRRARVPPAPVFPRHLVLLHGIAVACTFTLVLIAAAGQG